MKSSFRGVLLVLIVLASVATASENEKARVEPLDIHPLIAQFTVVLANKMHYAQRPHDDELSEKVFEIYLARLDPEGTCLSQDERKSFEKYRSTLDDALRLGDVSAGFEMFNACRDRTQASESPQMDSDAVFSMFINAYLSALDPHSTYFNQSELKDDAGERRVSSRLAEHVSPKRIGIITVPYLYRSGAKGVAEDVKAELERLGEIDGLLLDLRGNTGGVLKEAMDLTDIFLGKVPVVQARDTAGKVTTFSTERRSVAWDGPLLVLVDAYTASGAEVFAAAIQDYGAGVIAGEKTQGMGTLQNLIPLNRMVKTQTDLGAVKLTVGELFRVNGASLQKKGVQPDVLIGAAEEGDVIREDDRVSVLHWEEIEPLKHDAEPLAAEVLVELNEAVRSREPGGQSPATDWQLEEAIRVLVDFSGVGDSDNEREQQTR